MEDLLKKCNICPNKCMVNRYKEKGRCKASEKIKVAHICLHKFEEPCISFKNGSGAVFFSGCNLKCVFCQNYEINDCSFGKEISCDKLASIFLKLQNMGADNINLVSPTIYAYQIKEAIKIARKNGLLLPIIYNTNGYENVETLKALEGYIDIYMPDFKYFSSFLSQKYSKVKDYPYYAKKALIEMKRQIPENIYDAEGKLLKGVLIRHLVLPNHLINTKNVLHDLNKNFGRNINLSVMMQYFPTNDAKNIVSLSRCINKKEYKKVLEYIEEEGFTNGYIQQMPQENNEEKYVPNFDVSTLD